MKHPKTTIAGILMIVSALAKAGIDLINGTAVDYASTFAAVTGGIGLIKAADA